MFAPRPGSTKEILQLRVKVEDMESGSSSQSDSDEPPRVLQIGRLVLGGLVFAAIVGMAGLAGRRLAAAEQTQADTQMWGLDTGVQEKSAVYSDWAGAQRAAANSPNLYDGNICEDDEELFQGLCYKKCSILTAGASAVRNSAFSCGKSHGFVELFKSKVSSFVPCRGFDVAGDIAGKGCPHKPGACLPDEELSLGKCYKKCSLLTHGVYPFRTTADTCCKTNQLLQCMIPTFTKMSSKFGVGGGYGKDAVAHDPEARLTEAVAV
eukprot:gb/GFBE01001382.1/.p1 GENE.gb/GFBE01001382.1/~~gb/GFBE01001382.1/.p1  ORF type:complete len:265 (+),score=55.14 gb/GFBE01001382.1/:1-795(+)